MKQERTELSVIARTRSGARTAARLLQAVVMEPRACGTRPVDRLLAQPCATRGQC
jgi:hypothetical protein